MDHNRDTVLLIGLLVVALAGVYVPLRIDIRGLSLSIKRAMLILLVGASVFAHLRRRSVNLTYTDIGIWLLVAILVGSGARSDAPVGTARRLVRLVPHLAVYLAIMALPATRDTFDRLTHGLVLSGGVIVIAGILSLFIGSYNVVYPVPFVSRNHMARNILLLFPLTVIAAHLATGRRKLLYGLSAAAMVILVLMSGSRSGLVSMVLVGLLSTVLFLAAGRGWPATRVLATSVGFVGVGVIGVVVAIQFDLLPARLANIPTNLGELFSPTVLGPKRYYVYSQEIAAIRDHWLLGLGYGGFLDYTEGNPFGQRYQAHTLITRVWLAAGIVPVLLLIGVGVLVIRTYSQWMATLNDHYQLYVGAYFIGLLGIFTASMANIVLYDITFWIPLALGANFFPRMTTPVFSILKPTRCDT